MRKNKILVIATLILSSLTLTSFINFDTKDAVFIEKEYLLGPKSVLEVNGKTNVNSFCCTSQQRFSKGKFSYQFEAGTSIINFQNSSLKITIAELDCGAKAINNDLHKALQADQYPSIVIDLQQAFNLECSDLTDCDRWVEFEAVTDITIVCTSKSVVIPIQVKKIDGHKFRVIGETTIELCDFGIEAPTALLGLIKVKDTLKINFDLDINLL